MSNCVRWILMDTHADARKNAEQRAGQGLQGRLLLLCIITTCPFKLYLWTICCGSALRTCVFVHNVHVKWHTSVCVVCLSVLFLMSWTPLKAACASLSHLFLAATEKMASTALFSAKKGGKKPRIKCFFFLQVHVRIYFRKPRNETVNRILFCFIY